MKIFISGASSGLGLYLSKKFILQGDLVWGIGRGELKADDEERSFKTNFRYSRCDITSYADIKNTFAEMVKLDFIPDIAIFCAGRATEDIMESNFAADKFRENFDVNLFGALYWVEVLLPHFLKRNSGIFAAISSKSYPSTPMISRIARSKCCASINSLHSSKLGAFTTSH